jgi:hypothetical protein
VNDVGATIDGHDATTVPGSFALNGVRCQVVPQP